MQPYIEKSVHFSGDVLRSPAMLHCALTTLVACAPRRLTSCLRSSARWARPPRPPGRACRSCQTTRTASPSGTRGPCRRCAPSCMSDVGYAHPGHPAGRVRSCRAANSASQQGRSWAIQGLHATWHQLLRGDATFNTWHLITRYAGGCLWLLRAGIGASLRVMQLAGEFIN